MFILVSYHQQVIEAMKKLGGVFVTDGPCRGEDVRIAVRAFPQNLWDGCVEGLPSNLSHDSLRLVGWSRPTAVYLEAGITRLAGTMEMPETPDERKLLEQWAREAQGRRYAERREEINELRALLKSHDVDEARHCLTECVALFEKGLAARIFPELRQIAEKDKDGLVPLSKLDPLGPGVFRVGELAVFGHAYFRRSLSRLNSINAPFLKRLQSLESEGFPTKIALDWDLVGLASSYSPHFEFEYWWGPKFDENLANIEVGVSRHEASEIDRIFYGLSHTEFWWHSRDGLHTLEAEEVHDAPAQTEDEGVQGYFCRYVHSMIDESDGKVTHFDGAMRGYSEDAMIVRLGCDIKGAGRNSDYTKLWRLDSPIEVAQWKALLSDYYRDNRLVGEYLAEPEPSLVAKPGSPASSEDEAEQPFDVLEYVPHAIVPGTGIRMSLSFRPDQIDPNREREGIALHSVREDGQFIPVFESATLELRKLLERQGHVFHLPEKFYVSHPKDLHHDFGVLAHGEVALHDPTILKTTLEGMRALIHAWRAREVFGSVAFTLCFPVEERDVCIGVIGHINDVDDWLGNPLCSPPTNKEKLFLWLEEVADFLRDSFPPAGDTSPLLSAVMPFTGSLIRRKKVENLEFEKDEDGLKWVMNLDEIEEVPGLRQAMEEGAITPAPVFVVDKSRCGKCGGNYSRCGCIKAFDEDASEEITSCVVVEAIWSGSNMMMAQHSKP